MDQHGQRRRRPRLRQGHRRDHPHRIPGRAAECFVRSPGRKTGSSLLRHVPHGPGGNPGGLRPLRFLHGGGRPDDSRRGHGLYKGTAPLRRRQNHRRHSGRAGPHRCERLPGQRTEGRSVYGLRSLEDGRFSGRLRRFLPEAGGNGSRRVGEHHPDHLLRPELRRQGRLSPGRQRPLEHRPERLARTSRKDHGEPSRPGDRGPRENHRRPDHRVGEGSHARLQQRAFHLRSPAGEQPAERILGA
ncbi:hypothetical protein SDC9_57852 [bioreactor metagenome]|uniref:Uncharacterized protein n=1 Tax=bioreactor metagenome TaxID=1076179 RepID=A0A644X5S6_9ZZZZ